MTASPHPTRTPPPGPPTTPRGDFIRRLAIYCLGIAIGLVMVGLMQRGRQSRRAYERPPAASTLTPSAQSAAPPAAGPTPRPAGDAGSGDGPTP